MNTTENLILSHLFLAEKIAKSKKKKISQVSYDELKSAAYLGLVEAAAKYDEEKNDCFAAFAVWRIIGAIQDYLRELSWGSRHNVIKPLDVDICHVSEEDKSANYDDFDTIIDCLPDKNKNILKLYYQKSLKIKEIAGIFDLHESRISQIISDSKKLLSLTLTATELATAA